MTVAALMFAGLAFGVAPASAMQAKPVQVPLDVDVYDQPGGEGKPRGQFLKGGSEVGLMEQNADNWCHVESAKDPVPGGSGWIWCGMGDDGKNYAVKPVVAEKPTEPDMGGGGGGGGAAEPIKYDCKIIGPNEGAGGSSPDPKVTFKCVDIPDEGEKKGMKECCFYKQP